MREPANGTQVPHALQREATLAPATEKPRAAMTTGWADGVSGSLSRGSISGRKVSLVDSRYWCYGHCYDYDYCYAYGCYF